MEAVEDGLVDANAGDQAGVSMSLLTRVAFICGETCGVSDCLPAIDAAESAATECDNEDAVDACEIPTEDAMGLKEACDNTGVVDEDSGEGYIGLKR